MHHKSMAHMHVFQKYEGPSENFKPFKRMLLLTILNVYLYIYILFLCFYRDGDVVSVLEEIAAIECVDLSQAAAVVIARDTR